MPPTMSRTASSASTAATSGAFAAPASTAASISPLVVACLAATWLVWGSTYLAIKFALVSFPPFFQMGFARGTALPSPVQWRNAVVVGALMLGGGMGGTAVAEVSVGSGLVVAFIAVVPLMIALVNLAFGIRPGPLESAGIGVGLAGVLMLTQGAGFQASPAGLAAITIACVTWSVGSVLSQQRLPLAPGAMGFASEMLCGGIVLLVLSAFAVSGGCSAANCGLRAISKASPTTRSASRRWMSSLS